MHRFYNPELPRWVQACSLKGDEATHAVRVLRLRAEEVVTMLDGRGTRALARVTRVEAGRVTLQMLEVEQVSPPPIQITLFQALTKPVRMDWLVEKATELGAQCIQPVLTERTIARPDAERGARKTAKWQRTAIEALKQCGNAWLPRIEAARPMPDVLNQSSDLPLHILASLNPAATVLREALDQLNPKPWETTPVSVGIWIGPEGDFTEGETQALRSAGALPVTLGRNVLRSETAAVCALALVDYELRYQLTHQDRSA